MKKMTLGNRILAMLLAFVMILTGIAPGTFNARVVKAADATEQRFNRIYREDGIVQVTNSIYQNSDSILTPEENITSYQGHGRPGEVTDNSQVIRQSRYSQDCKRRYHQVIHLPEQPEL